MHHSCTSKSSLNLFTSVFLITLTIFPIAPNSSKATDVNSDKVVILQDRSKSDSNSPQAAPQAGNFVVSQKGSSSLPKPETLENEKKTVSTKVKVIAGVGIGAVAIAGIAALAGSGSSGSSGGSDDSAETPATSPTAEQMVGRWQANANSADGRTYTGTYTLYAGGSQSYDLYISDGRHKADSGSWTLADYTLILRNSGGSTYKGIFTEGVQNRVTLINTDGSWTLVITK